MDWKAGRNTLMVLQYQVRGLESRRNAPKNGHSQGLAGHRTTRIRDAERSRGAGSRRERQLAEAAEEEMVVVQGKGQAGPGSHSDRAS